MARSPIEIGIASETKAFRQGVESGIIAPLEDAEKALDDLGRSRGPEQLEKSIRDAQDETKDLKKEVAKTADAIERDFKDSYRSAGKSAQDGMGKARDATKEVTQEVGQNLGEAVSSIRGDLSDLGQVGQDTLGGLAASLAGAGPGGLLGAAALAAGAVGLGAITAELQRQQEEADRMRERISGAYQQAAEDGQRFIDTQAMIADASDLMFNTDRAEEYKRVQGDTAKLGLDLSTVIRANSGDLDAQAEIQDRINALLQDANSYELVGTTNKKQLKGDVADLRDRWADVNKTTQEYADKASTLRDVSSDMLLGAVQSAQDAQVEIDALGNKLVTFQDEHGEQKVFIDAQTGEATSKLDRFKGDVDGKIDQLNGRDVVLSVRPDTSRWDSWVPPSKWATLNVNVVGPTKGGYSWGP